VKNINNFEKTNNLRGKKMIVENNKNID